MHNEIRDFFTRAKSRFPSAFNATHVMEFGSYDINGSVRPYFNAQEYVGLDHREGPGVDVVCMAEEYQDKPHGYFDTVVSSSMLEHDPRWMQSVTKMVQMVREGGTLIITCGGPGFPPHEIHTAPAGQNPEAMPTGTYYGNVRMADLANLVLSLARWETVILEDDPVIHDVRVVFHRKY